ncbi:hypothetical protein LCGC14_0231410 [marine sediment metagenome]|uniref:Uncharacterized protein n=1 Tax=marine sediment metagenome TaxID=412755 RepID=A0A0F9UEE2_9ZZZZ
MRTQGPEQFDHPCKIGTVPAVVRVRKNEKFEPGAVDTNQGVSRRKMDLGSGTDSQPRRILSG